MESPTVERQWLDYREAEQFTGLGRTTLYELARAGEVVVSRVGTGEKRRTTRFSRESLDAYMRRNICK